jgi:cysteine-S-conjugate beta-lyase
MDASGRMHKKPGAGRWGITDRLPRILAALENTHDLTAWSRRWRADMAYDFDERIERYGTDSLKFDFAARRGKPDGLLPLWVADMDFRTPDCVIDALVEKSRHGIFGYSESRDDYFEVLRSWFSDRFGWQIRPEWHLKTPGVVFAIYAAIRALSQEGDAVLIQPPVYYPFSEAVRANKRRLIVNELVYEEGKYSLDLCGFEKQIAQEGVKLFILCSPHNPVGRVWTRDELCHMGEICQKHGVIVLSDEIHADFVHPGHHHLVFADVKPEFADFTVTCTAPTKTFNLAGLQVSNIFVSNRETRRRLREEIGRTGYGQLNIMGLVACKAAYSTAGAQWLEALNLYMTGNLDFLRSALRDTVVRLVEPEGTYLVWLDFSALTLSDSALDALLVEKAKLWLDIGTMFGDGGSGFARINIACPRALLKQAAEQLTRPWTAETTVLWRTYNAGAFVC